MCAARLLRTHPIVGSRDLDRTIPFYVERLGFTLAFEDGQNPRNYVGLRRDDVELHFQFQHEDEMGIIRLRFLVSDPDALLADFQARQAFTDSPTPATSSGAARVALTAPLKDTPWGTREFGFYDPDGNALHFYRDLA
jgi:catechol 2,3-dioxygenase-like lactoylglutathione lyase family enzyme